MFCKTWWYNWAWGCLELGPVGGILPLEGPLVCLLLDPTDGGTLALALWPTPPLDPPCPGPEAPLLPPRARAPAVGSPGDLDGKKDKEHVLHILGSNLVFYVSFCLFCYSVFWVFGLTWEVSYQSRHGKRDHQELTGLFLSFLWSFFIFELPEWRLISPNPGNVIIENGLIAISIVRQYQLLPQNVRQTSRGALRNHRAAFFGKFPRKPIVDLLLSFQLLKLLSQNGSKLCWRKLVGRFCGNPAT